MDPTLAKSSNERAESALAPRGFVRDESERWRGSVLDVELFTCCAYSTATTSLSLVAIVYLMGDAWTSCLSRLEQHQQPHVSRTVERTRVDQVQSRSSTSQDDIKETNDP